MLSCPSLTHIIYLFIEIKSPFSLSFNHAALQHHTVQYHKDIFHMCSAKWGAEIAVPIFKLNCALCAGTQWWQYITFQTCNSSPGCDPTMDPTLLQTHVYCLLSIWSIQYHRQFQRQTERYNWQENGFCGFGFSLPSLRNIIKEKGNVISRYLPRKLSCLQHIFPGILEIETRECLFYLQPAAWRWCCGWD